MCIGGCQRACSLGGRAAHRGACSWLPPSAALPLLSHAFRAVPAFELAILRAIFHSKGPKA
jgi:hypothetical protein